MSLQIALLSLSIYSFIHSDKHVWVVVVCGVFVGFLFLCLFVCMLLGWGFFWGFFGFFFVCLFE